MDFEVRPNVVHVEVSIPEEHRNNLFWKGAFLDLEARFLRWGLQEDLEPPVTPGIHGPLGWSDAWSNKAALKVLEWLDQQPEMKSDFSPAQLLPSQDP